MFALKQLARAVPTLVITALLVTVWLGWHHYSTHYLHPTEEHEAATEQGERTEVVLGPEKMEAAKIKIADVEPRTSKLSVMIPGRVTYDPAQMVSVRLGSAGILTRIEVRPGDHVEQGQVLATISSPEVGTARADQMQHQSALELAKRQLVWDKSRSESIRKLADAIKTGKSPEEIRLNFSDKSIGDARERLLSAYTDKLLAASTVARMASVAESGAISSRVVDERKSNLDARQAALQSTIEQTLFDADREAREAQIALDDAQRRWEIASNRVTTLLGLSATPVDDAKPSAVDNKADSLATAAAKAAAAADLSVIELRAPRAGTIEKRHFNENERIEPGAVLFDIADTKRLWIQADIRESQWNALGLKAGQHISWSSPALPGEVQEATIVMMGREVNPQTNAIALVAAIDNAYGKLRPGLYVRVELPMGETVSQIVIPESAVARHEGQTFVFVSGEPGKFVRRDVRLGQTASTSMGGGGAPANMVEVIAGLNVGEKIAVDGVFHLKSELLLEAEE